MTLMARRRDSPVSFQITPMIDMTFLLLIFFMVTTKLTDQQIQVPVNLPVAKSAVAPADLTNRVVINVDGDGQYYIGDAKASKEEVDEHLKFRFKDYPPLQIYLRMDSQSPAKKTREFMEMATEAGALDVIFGTYQK